MEDFEPIEIEFLINNPQLLADSKKAEQALVGVSDAAQKSAQDAANTISANIKRMESDLSALRQSAVGADPLAAGQYNNQIKILEGGLTTQKRRLEDLLTPIKEVESTGKKAFEAVGEAAGKSTNYFQKAWSGLRTLAQILPGIGIGGILAFAVGPILEYISTLDIFNKKASALEEANKDIGAAMGKAGSEAAKATLEVAGLTEKFKLAKDGIIAKKSVLDEYNNTIGKTIGFTKDINVAEERTLKNGDAYIELMFRKAAAEAQLGVYRDKMAKAAEELAKTDDEAGDYSLSGTKGKLKNTKGEDLFAASAERNRKKAAQPYIDAADEVKKVWVKTIDDTAQYAKDHKLNLYDNSTDTGKAAADLLKQQQAKADELLRAQTSLQERIKEFKDKSGDKQLDDDQAALAAISNQFDGIKFQIKTANDEYDKFIANGKKLGIDNTVLAKKKGLVKIDPKSVDAAETSALSNQTDLNNTKHIAEDIEKKKQLYAEYENYKAKLGSDAANKEYANLLQSGQTFEVFVKTLQSSLSGQEGNLSPAAFEARKKLYEKYAQDIQKEQSGINLQMLAETLDYHQRTNLIIEKSLDDADKLQKAGYTMQAHNRLQQGADELDALHLQNEQTVASYENLYKSIEGLTVAQAKLELQSARIHAKTLLDKGEIDADYYQKLIDGVNKADAAIKSNAIINDLNAIADALLKIGENATGLDKGFASALTSVGNTIKDVAALKKNIADLKEGVGNYAKTKADAGGGFLGSVSAVASIIPVAGAVIGFAVKAVGAVVGFFKAAGETARQSAAEIQRYQNSLISGEVTYNELLRERAAAIKNINDLTAQQLIQQQQLLAGQKVAAQNDFDRILSIIQGQGEQVTGEHTEKYGGFLGIAKKTKVVQDLAGLGGVDYDQLEKLYTEGKLTDATKTWFEQLKKVHDEMGSISDATDQVKQQLDQVFTGTTADSLEKAILDGLKAGKRGFADFSDDFGTSIQNAISSTFESTYLQDKVQAFYKQFADLSESGGSLTKDEISKLEKAYTTLVNGASSSYQNLLNIVGQVSGNTATQSTSSLAGKIVCVTIDQADSLLNHTHLYQIQLNNKSK